jgi:hypothetical protein
MLFDKCNNTKAQGNIGIGRAIAYYTQQGYTVSVPMNDSQEYDLVIDIQSILYKVQVKTTSYKTPAGNYQATLKSAGGTSGKIYARVCDSEVDYIFILTDSGDTYNIPWIDVENLRNCITLGDKYLKYKV